MWQISNPRRALLFANTVVTFIDAWGRPEEGEDLGTPAARVQPPDFSTAVRPRLGLTCHAR